jgi:hypothetical protein
MSVKQLSIVLENVPGKLFEVSEFLGIEGINIRAINVADSSNFSTVRFVADDPKKTATVLKSRGYIVSEMDVIAVEVPDHPGGLQSILKPLYAAKINVLYLYPFLGKSQNGQTILILGSDKIEDTAEVLKNNWVHTFGPEIYSL